MNIPQTQLELIEQLGKAQSVLNTFFTLSLDLLCIYGEDGYYKQLSPAWEKVLGWTHSELCQQPWIELVYPDDMEITLSAEMRCTPENLVEYENRYRHKNGSYRWLSWRVSQDKDGFSYGVAKDITAAKQLEEALRDRDPVAVPDSLQPYPTPSENGHENSATEPSLAVATPGASAISYLTQNTACVEVEEENLQRAVIDSALQAIVELEIRVEEHTAQIRQASQQLSAEIAIHQRTKAALEKSEEQFQRVFDKAPIGMMLEGLDTRFIRVNRALCEMLGYTKSELMSLTCVEITHPEEREQQISYTEQLKKGDIDGFQLEKRFLKKNQEIVWVNLTLMALKGEAGESLYILGMVEDITQYKHTLEALRQSEARYRAIVENQTELICRFKPDDTITFVNDAYCRYFNMPRESLIGHKFLPPMPSEDRKLISQNFRALSLEQPINTYEHRIILSNGEIRWQQWSDRALFDEQGNFIECQAVGRDITPLKQAEADVCMALVKERELSELRAGFVSLVSHEFRTPLTTIQSSAELLEYYNDRLSDEKKQNHFTRIQNAVNRMTQLLEDVLTIGQAEAGKLKFNPEPIDLVAFCGNIVENMQIIVNNKHGSKSPQHAINFVTLCNYADAQMDKKLLEHIITNLLSNAIKYSPGGGNVQFDLVCNAESAVFRIQDTGIGIPKQDLEKLFDSFGRASNVGTIQGTGLGLAIVKKCVDLHGGKIAVESQLGVGTTFTVTLPLNN